MQSGRTRRDLEAARTHALGPDGKTLTSIDGKTQAYLRARLRPGWRGLDLLGRTRTSWGGHSNRLAPDRGGWTRS